MLKLPVPFPDTTSLVPFTSTARAWLGAGPWAAASPGRNEDKITINPRMGFPATLVQLIDVLMI